LTFEQQTNKKHNTQFEFYLKKSFSKFYNTQKSSKVSLPKKSYILILSPLFLSKLIYELPVPTEFQLKIENPNSNSPKLSSFKARKNSNIIKKQVKNQ
jgi:hypothetical protein